ncbi:MAG: hypothetical protein ACOH2D_10030 [Gelidibacter sp.]|uniref:hypothetical protein n=1 Tax=Gelidibacter sp. TaxID=2018083 RepID=UPI00326559EA
MKKLLILAFLLPLMAIGQNTEEYSVFETAILSPNPAQVSQFEKGLTSHNKKYHGEGLYGTRVYWISNGPNTGSYAWVMGPFPWSAIDYRPTTENGHDIDWDNNVMPYVTAGSGGQSYWKFNSEVSRFSKDFTIKNMLVDYYDVKRGKMKDAMKLIEKINKAYAEKLPNETYGIYTNEFGSTKEGRDIAVISFFDKSSWIGQNNEMDKKYDEVYGKGSWDQFLKDWYDVTVGAESELWIFRPDLSGISGEVKAPTRQ